MIHNKDNGKTFFSPITTHSLNPIIIILYLQPAIIFYSIAARAPFSSQPANSTRNAMPWDSRERAVPPILLALVIWIAAMRSPTNASVVIAPLPRAVPTWSFLPTTACRGVTRGVSLWYCYLLWHRLLGTSSKNDNLWRRERC
jgi:hypothetical protein